MNFIYFFTGLLAVIGTFILGIWLFKRLTVSVQEETATLVLQFGKLNQVLYQPGLHFMFSKIWPWTKTLNMSLQRDFREFNSISLNEKHGTNVIVDLWLEFKVLDPAKALFEVEDWEEALRSLVVHSATSILCAKDFQEIVQNRDEISELMLQQVSSETKRWGVQVTSVLIKNVGLQPDVSRMILGSVSAKLERAKALVQEEGRLNVEKISAMTDAEIAELNAQAKSQYGLAVGRAYFNLKKDRPVFKAYQELYELSRMVPQKVVRFDGFRDDVRAIDAAMIAPSFAESNHASREALAAPQPH